jgi:F-type H+-transporting ATPase subunit epsilon
MAASPFTLTLVTPEKKIMANQPIAEVFIPGYRGEINILPGHVPLLTTLSTGVMRYRLAGSSELSAVAISWGYAQVTPTGVNVMAETAERPEDIDVPRAEATLEEAEREIKQVNADWETIQKYQRKIERATVRKEVASRGPLQ